MPNKLKIKTKDISIVSSSVVESKCWAATEFIDKSHSLDSKIGSLSFEVKVYPIEYKDPKRVLIPTGVASNPKGISKSGDDIVAFIYRDGKESFPHLFTKCIRMSDLKTLIKQNWDKAEKIIDESGDFSTLCVVCSID